MSRTAKTLAVALAISILIHLLLLGAFPEFKWPDFEHETGSIHAEIVTPKKPVEFKPLSPPRPKAKKPVSKLARLPVKTPEPAASAPVPESAPEPASEAVSTPAPVSKPEPSAKPPEKKGIDVPAHARLTFRVFKGGANVGMAVHTWDIMDDGRYVITNKVEAIGIFALFVKGSMTQVSEGHVTGDGLRPDLYTIIRGSEENRQSAHFDWKSMKLELVSNGASKEVKLDPMTQDQLSFLYQFAYTPPKSGIFSFHATDGRKIDIYDYQILGEETLLSGTMKIRTLHLKKLHDPGVEGTEIWLDEDHYYWPVQVVMTDKNGDTMKQLISEIEEK